MFYRRFKLFMGLFLVLVLGGELLADTKGISERFMTKADAVVAVVKNKSLATDARMDKIIQTIDPLFDFRLMARLSLGKKRWNALGEAKQKEFTDLYVKRMKSSYSQKIDAYTDEKIIVRESKQLKKNRVVLVTDLVGSDDKTEVVYKYHKSKGKQEGKDEWLIYDAVISGVSIITTDKSQFKEVLRENSIDVLMDKMRNGKK